MPLTFAVFGVLGTTQQAWAEEEGLSAALVSQALSGKRTAKKVRFKIATAVGVSLRFLDDAVQMENRRRGRGGKTAR